MHANNNFEIVILMFSFSFIKLLRLIQIKDAEGGSGWKSEKIVSSKLKWSICMPIEKFYEIPPSQDVLH